MNVSHWKKNTTNETNIFRKKLLSNAVSRLECPLLVCKYKIRFFFLKLKRKTAANIQNICNFVNLVIFDGKINV